MTLAPPTLADLTERDFTAQAIGTKTNPGLARMLGWFCVHHLRSKGTEPGVPDWWLLREREVWLELKREGGKLSPAQKDVIRRMLAAGVEIYVVRPRDLDALGKVLACRGDPYSRRGEIVEIAARLREQTVRETERV